ncbi:MAG: hypothetical protein IKP96_05105 [Elusimicrobiaceae bacterium]|nr:hypothetical protein [Elusimicrobiaceae bacterium]
MDVLLHTPALSVYEHMALDEQTVQTRSQMVTLRFYHWTAEPAVTFGYAQFIREVRARLKTRGFAGAYARRPTGGGMVFHEDDLTFSLVFPSEDKPVAIYQKLHTTLLAHLAQAGISGQLMHGPLPAEAYAPSVKQQASACFIRPVENDLLTKSGQKMLGGAIRRLGTTVLYQGSLQLPAARQHPVLKRAIINAVREFLAIDLRPVSCDETLLAQAKQLAVTQYNTLAWTEKF